MPRVDPLEGLESRPPEVQVAVLANEVRNQRNALSEVKDTLGKVLFALLGVILSTVGGILLVFVGAVAGWF